MIFIKHFEEKVRFYDVGECCITTVSLCHLLLPLVYLYSTYPSVHALHQLQKKVWLKLSNLCKSCYTSRYEAPSVYALKQ